jgi:hypothetical protein
LLERVVQLRRRKAAEVEAAKPEPAAEAAAGVARDDPAAASAQRINALEARVQHLEAVLEGLQDSVHRESVRRGRQIEGLQEKTEPLKIRRAISRDARDRGI